MAQAPRIDLLLTLVPDHPEAVLEHLRTNPQLAASQDAHGYSLLHAAISYGHADLARALVKDFNVDPNILDEDQETCLFSAETVDMAKEALALGVDANARNTDGQTAAEKLDDEDEQPEIAAFLRETMSSGGNSAVNGLSGTAQPGQTNGTHAVANGPSSEDDGIREMPPLPPGIQINLGTMSPGDVGDAPDPELRRRIEELAARSDFESEETQAELRKLISDALAGAKPEDNDLPPTTRRRLD